MLCCFSCVQLSVTLWIIALQALLSMGFAKQEYWSGLPFPSPGDLPDPDIEPVSPVWQGDSLLLSHLVNININYQKEVLSKTFLMPQQ